MQTVYILKQSTDFYSQISPFAKHPLEPFYCSFYPFTEFFVIAFLFQNRFARVLDINPFNEFLANGNKAVQVIFLDGTLMETILVHHLIEHAVPGVCKHVPDIGTIELFYFVYNRLTIKAPLLQLYEADCVPVTRVYNRIKAYRQARRP